MESKKSGYTTVRFVVDTTGKVDMSTVKYVTASDVMFGEAVQGGAARVEIHAGTARREEGAAMGAAAGIPLQGAVRQSEVRSPKSVISVSDENGAPLTRIAIRRAAPPSLITHFGLRTSDCPNKQ